MPSSLQLYSIAYASPQLLKTHPFLQASSALANFTRATWYLQGKGLLNRMFSSLNHQKREEVAVNSIKMGLHWICQRKVERSCWYKEKKRKKEMMSRRNSKKRRKEYWKANSSKRPFNVLNRNRANNVNEERKLLNSEWLCVETWIQEIKFPTCTFLLPTKAFLVLWNYGIKMHMHACSLPLALTPPLLLS